MNQLKKRTVVTNHLVGSVWCFAYILSNMMNLQRAFIVRKGRAKRGVAKLSLKVTDQKEEDKGKDKQTQRTVRKE